MIYSFDRLIGRQGTDCVKYDMLEERGLAADTIPLWVADMDFQAPPAVSRSLANIAEQNIYGYTFVSDNYRQSVLNWFGRRFDWRADPGSLMVVPGVVFAVSTSILAYTQEGDGVLIQEPVYHPFRAAIESNSRRTVVSELQLVDGHYEIDFEDFERKIRDEAVKLFVLCSPHNPVGRVWTREELLRIGEICLKHGVVVVSDEIHADFVYGEHKHRVFASVDPRFKDMTVTCTAASKTFNLAGLACSNIFIENEQMRADFKVVMNQMHVGGSNMMGLAATCAAYNEGEEWLDQLLVYLTQTVSMVRGFLKNHMPDIKLIEPEGTYLLWLDFSALGIDQESLNELLLKDAKVWLHAGTVFGQAGERYFRMNIACPRATVREALTRIYDTFYAKPN